MLAHLVHGLLQAVPPGQQQARHLYMRSTAHGNIEGSGLKEGAGLGKGRR